VVPHYREQGPEGERRGDPVILVHGFPESSRMWGPLMDALSSHGRRCVAPDLYCLGESDDPGPATFERNLEALDALHRKLTLERVTLVVHDWGGFIGLAWACENPDLVSAVVISDTGFFSDGKWHGLAEAVRSPQGEELMAGIDRDGFAALLRIDGAEFSEEDVDAYWRPFAEGRGREATVEFYRSMDFEKLEQYEGQLAELGVPTLVLWGADDRFAPLSGARRFEREIPGSHLVAIEGAGHFVFDQEPERTVREVVDFLS
jgi:haloalkane dehalogenase